MIITITKYDKFAFTPKRCSECNRLFIFEEYNIYEKLYLPNAVFVKCKECVKKKEVDKND